jgi:glycine betaine/proline transport system substrate-binding protein
MILVLAMIVSGCAAPAADTGAAPSESEAPSADTEAPAADTEEASEDMAADEAEKETVKIADVQWQTIWVNNAIAQFIIENGYDYPVETVEVTTPIAQQALVDGELDIHMELWRYNILDWYNEVTESGELIDLGDTFEKSTQGWYVPRYVIEGDAERGIEPMAPDLVSVFDLPEYKELFADPEDPDKGLLLNCITGWQCATSNRAKLHAYGLDDDYNSMEPGATAALDAGIAGAFKKGEPILAYYWEPTWLMGAYDMVQLEEPEWSIECDNELQRAVSGEIEVDEVSEIAGCGFQTYGIHKAVSNEFNERAPELVEFLQAMTVGTDPLNKTSAYMSENETSAEEAALWFFANYQDVWRDWVPDDVEAKVDAALTAEGVEL